MISPTMANEAQKIIKSQNTRAEEYGYGHRMPSRAAATEKALKETHGREIDYAMI